MIFDSYFDQNPCKKVKGVTEVEKVPPAWKAQLPLNGKEGFVGYYEDRHRASQAYYMTMEILATHSECSMERVQVFVRARVEKLWKLFNHP
jgi:hypothetical protein